MQPPDLPASLQALLDEIQELTVGRTSRREETRVLEIFVGLRGAELTRLKNAIDAAADHHDLHQLVYRDIDDDAVREQLLAHFAEAAEPSGEVKILSDIDDTFYANWKDQRYPPKTVYPGVLQLYTELDRGPQEEPGRAGDLTFVTARPGDRLGLVEGATRDALTERGVETKAVLTGSFRRVLSSRAIADQKVQNFLEYRRLYPEYAFVLIGDSGQGDIRFGQRMLELAPGEVRGVLIHDVVATPAPRREELAAGGVSLFDTYVGAAVEALRRGLIHPEGAARVAAAAQAELALIPFESPGLREDREAELARDVALLSALAYST